MVIPGTSNPLIAMMYSESFMKEVFSKKEEAMDVENP
jgi:hypothetical protein